MSVLKKPFTAIAAAIALCATSLGALADEPRYNQVSLRAEVSQEVAHDLMHVTLFNEGQGTDPAKLAAETTTALNAAVEQARKVKGVTVSLGSRNSYPVYDDKGQKITAWRERAEIRLESTDFAALSQLTADLLGKLKMGSMDFSIADATRAKNEDAMMKGAVDAFKARAQVLTDALGGKGYKLVSLNLNTSGAPRPMPVMRMAAAKFASMDSAPAQEIEAGTSQVTVSADGTIEVQMP
ncbi:periplasmic/secreted protein [Pseudomonas sp. 21]|uniref:SIMPL domain-containing protein n=1 Tax=unclassified Pseudomonas TaxID=196821 RepID=UPI0005EBCFD5|nr:MULTISPECIES: SIMPL domain-containing protein [unclassified Pseudomonas]KJK01610.1 periplasmic/secreted protein [Pseudomonas sp. 21]MBV7582257.1 SIMPL domain-containing protein [Pseudomonas sp. PDM33]